MVTRYILRAFQIENFQNITRVHKSGNALAFMRFPILIVFAVIQH